MANIESSPAILGMKVVRIGGKGPGAIRVAVRFSERVCTVERDPRIDSRCQSCHKLVLPKNATRLVQINRRDAGRCYVRGGSNGARTQAVPAYRVEIVDR